MRRVRQISREEHLAFIAEQPSVSPLQCPSWGEVKAGWRAESVGWDDGSGRLVGAGLVLHRRLPVLGRTLAYLPEGPSLPWEQVAEDVAGWLVPLVGHLRRGGAFAVRMGPPVEVERWEAATLKAAVAAGTARRLGDVPPDATTPWVAGLREGLAAQGWRPPAEDGDGHGFSAGQPRHVFQLPLAGRSLDEVRAGLNQLWRRNVKKAEKGGVVVREGGAEDLPAFHALYVHTAERDGFVPRPLGYFEGMWRAMRAEDPRRLRLFLAEHEGEPLAAATLVTVGDHATYSYGASASHRRELRPSNAVQWRMVEEAHAAGCAVYDLRGISDTLDAQDPLFGLVQFKLGTGGHALAYLGEWDLPLHRLLHRAFETYLARR
ncbi:lipid II:glycine glycyltransferase FemX [Vallicoccus soli]|uniref:Peptidoglycan bridge formation glycyltransferase FemA/FemB family protein n=1 Tax=Vallicoccus soli TaxID=2339232 RepID=A0A3A3YYG5_9ACTN|nr:peptidoglycan bridge formation glycyltransferase FemA/FemB family protein [Vallicoccus soli]RJK94168.1 peptidoglycan bridge formation glycyltransferase FemA/FemB family protein [Vallicoccus soli]